MISAERDRPRKYSTASRTVGASRFSSLYAGMMTETSGRPTAIR
jgi:hypothetical protein